jgi:hypothetical protein
VDEKSGAHGGDTGVDTIAPRLTRSSLHDCFHTLGILYNEKPRPVSRGFLKGQAIDDGSAARAG